MSNQSLFATTSSSFAFPEPTTPTSPTNPTAPTVPTNPNVPTAPTNPITPTNPTEPTTPTNPTEPTTPTDAGETFEEALDLGIFDANTSGVITDGVGSSDLIDLYQFSIDQSNDFSFTLDGLSADADLYIFDGNGEIMGYSENADLTAEALEGNLTAGTYFLGVASYDGIDTSYDLTISAGNSTLSSLESNSSSDLMSMSQEFSLM